MLNFNSLLQFAADFSKKVKDGAHRLAEAGNFNRSAIVVALVAYWPDKSASQAEIRKGIKAIHAMTGGVFEPRAMETKVLEHIQTLKDLDDVGKLQLFRELSGVTDKDDAEYLVGIGVTVGKADGEPGVDPFSDDEKALVREIALKLNLDPAKFGL